MVTDRLIVSALFCVVGWSGLNPEPPVPMTLQQKAKYKSVNAVCIKKKQSKQVKQMCKRWEEHRS
jgi:hypothetical protein